MKTPERIKVEIEFIPVEEKLPIDIWRKESWFKESGNCVFGTFFGVVDNGDLLDDPSILIVNYLPEDGFVYAVDMSVKYDGKPWRVTHWAEIPEIKSK